MVRSRYTRVIDLGDGMALLFCAANGALAEIDRETYPTIERLLADPIPPTSESERELWDALVANGFLVDDDLSEVDSLHRASLSGRETGDYVSLTIAPTLACNFACDYCFESHSSVRMSAETELALLAFTDRNLANATGLMVTWFGGEPTLCLPTIERLQRGFLEICTRRGVAFDPASIITNGYLLDKAMATRLRDIGVTTAQVTIDGPRKSHDNRRKLRNGRGTYNRILDNVAESFELLDIVVRINVDKDNVASAIDVVRELNERVDLRRVNVHFAQVTASGETCSSVRDRCFNNREFSQSLVELYRRLFDHGIRVIDYPEVFAGPHCGAISEGCFVVSPTGLLFRCWEELSLDPARSTGDIFSEHTDDAQRANLNKYLSWDPFTKSECRECDILPICMGGCPLHGMKNSDTNKGACSPFKHNLRDMLVLRYLYDAGKEVTT